MKACSIAMTTVGFSLLLLTGCQCLQNTTSANARAPGFNFDQFVFLEDSAETTANASIGDLDGDGDLDMVLAKGRHWPLGDLVLLNDGQGGFKERHALGTDADRSYTAALADLDGDNDLDMVVGNDRPDPKRVYFNDSHGHFALAGTFGRPQWATRNITVADLNGDQRPDIIVANRGGPDNLSENNICFNDGHGRFPSCQVLSTESATTIAAADVDGNGSIDLVVPHRDRGQSYLFLNDGSGKFTAKLPIGGPDAATRAVAFGALSGSGRPDLIMGDELRGAVFVYTNLGNGKFAEALSVSAEGDRVYAIAVADLNQDGKPDIVLGNDGTPSMTLMNRGDGRSFASTRFGDGDGAVYGLAIADVTGDGCPDIVAARSNARSIMYVNACGK